MITRHRALHARCQPRHEPGTLMAKVTPSTSTPRRRTLWTPSDDAPPPPPHRAILRGGGHLAGVALVIMTLVPGAGLRRAARFASRAVWALARVFFAVLTAAAAVFFAGVRDHPGGVLGGDGVGVQGVQGEMGAAVAEVVLLPPP